MKLQANMPAEMYRRVSDEALEGPCDDIVARGPLIILAHGLMAIEPAKRRHYHITSAHGSLTHEEVAIALRGWLGTRPRPPIDQ